MKYRTLYSRFTLQMKPGVGIVTVHDGVVQPQVGPVMFLLYRYILITHGIYRNE